MRSTGLVLLALAAGWSGCAVRPVEPRNLSALKAEIVGYVDSGRYEQQIKIVANQAAEWIEGRAGEALGAKNNPAPRLAVVFDIDETILSNLPEMRTMDFGYQAAAWNAWVDRGEAPAIAPVLEVFQRARRLGVEAIFVTGRTERDRVGTEKNLQAIGVVSGEGVRVIFKPEGAKESAQKFKTAVRARLTGEGIVIIANIGDQESDLAGGYAERTFKLPDPFYLLE